MNSAAGNRAEQTGGVAPHPPLFFSYARADQPRVLPIIRALEASGLAIWWDGLIESGARFAAATETALDQAPAVIVAWSRAAVGSHWVNDEAAAGRDRRVLVPISLDGSVAPLGFRQFQVIDLSEWNGDSAAPEFQRILRGIAAVMTADENRRAPPVGAPTDGVILPARPSRRTLILAGSGIFGLVGVAALGGAWQSGSLGAGADDHSIAVLPFETIGDAARAYFAEGLSAELRSQLSRNAALRVIAPSSSASAGEAGGDAAAIARQLGVAHLLEGDVRWSGEAARITANLIDRETNSNSWSKTFDLTVDNVFAVQSEIAAAVTAAISTAIVDNRAAEDAGGTRNATAFDEYLRGRDLYARASSEAMDLAALAHFDAAIAADRDFAAAHAARARSLVVIGGLYGDLAETRANYAAALTSARRAVALAPDHAESQSTLGFVLAQARLDIRAARAPFERSRTLGQGDAIVLTRFAQYAGQTGRFADARTALDRAIMLDPLNPLLLRIAGQLAYWQREPASALAPLERALAITPELSEAQASYGNVLLMLGRFDEAAAAFRRETSVLLRETGLAIAYYRLGRPAAAAAARQRVVTGLGSNQVTHYQQAEIAAQWGEAEAAMAALLAARVAGDSGLVTLKVNPLLDPLRGRDGFTALLAALHFD